MYTEDELLPISALQHLVFCERQWALIHLEGLWEENPLTVEGRFLHDRVDVSETEVRGNLRIARSLPLRSLRLGLSGKADVVEFHRLLPEMESDAPEGRNRAIALPDVPGLWTPFPVEYKRGRPKADPCDKVQLCAQALCLEEMLNAAIPGGALFYGKPRRRYEVGFDPSLREETEALAARLHELHRAGKTPSARYEPKCENCSLMAQCLPRITGSGKSARKYLAGALDQIKKENN